MTEEYFWGLTLKGAKAKSEWSPDVFNNSAKGAFRGEHSLVVKQAVLGADAKESELNVVEVEVPGMSEPVRIPILRLQVPHSPQVMLDLTFPDPPVTFTLVQGNGPVHLAGNHGVSGPADEVEEEEEGDEDLAEEEEENLLDDEDMKIIEGKKRKASPGNAVTKKAKIDQDNEDEDEDGEDEDESKKGKGLANANSKKTPVGKKKK